MTTLKVGSQGNDVSRWTKKMNARYKSYSTETDGVTPLKDDKYFGYAERDVQKRWQANMKRPVTGVVSDAEFAYVVDNTPFGTGGGGAVPGHRPIWLYSAPGSGASWNVGPSFDLGEMVCGHRPGDPNRQNLAINHQPLGFPMGGYLGLMGGDSTLSYVEVTYAEMKSLETELDRNPDINDPNLELWFSAYSQSADGMEDALEVLFGDGGFIHPGDKSQTPSPPGRFKHLRDRINGVIQFGNPSKQGTGIARKVRPSWLAAKVRNVTATNDFYAEAPDAIRPAFYAIIIEAETELPFFVHVLKVAVPVILGYVPILGLFGPLAQQAVAVITGLASGTLPLLGGLMGQANSADEKVDRDLIEMLSVTGLIKNLPGLIQLIGALPGLQAHGEYWMNRPEFGGRTGPEVGYDIIASFRR